MSNKASSGKMVAIVLLLYVASCSSSCENTIERVKISFPGEDVSKARLDIHTDDIVDASVKYWAKNEKGRPFRTQVSRRNNNHSFLLTHLVPGQQYSFTIITTKGSATKESANYLFNTIDYPKGIKDTFQVICPDPADLPDDFRQGYVMVYRREVPGLILLFDVSGNIVWYHQLKDAGFKVARFTDNGTILCIAGTKGYETGYGNSILELSLAGDTLLYLQKGQNDFNQTIHHEILFNSKNEIVTLCKEERIYDLRAKGGLEKDTVTGDGILVMDRSGKKIWKWTVFDELDPLKDDSILKNRKDWGHANSISFDKDGNYLISFYNNGQIWKVDVVTGKVIWKLGRNGDFTIPGWAAFDEPHAVHVNDQGCIMFFDNGGKDHLSKSVAFRLDERAKIADPVIETRLPPQLFSDRMGSSYLISDDYLLFCISKHKTVALTNLQGQFLWELRSNRLMSYRAEFIEGEKVKSYLSNLNLSQRGL